MYKIVGKRLFDIFLAGIALMLLSPLLILVALAIRLEDGGPTLFHQDRVGRCGKSFTLLKFRSMPVNTKVLPSAKAGTIKITRIGVFIRRTNFDEIPQLINILRGDMSVVGPRPALRDQGELCIVREKMGTLDYLPGLTGLAQVNSYDGMTDIEKATWDALYCANISFINDLIIILRTVSYLLKPPPVY